MGLQARRWLAVAGVVAVVAAGTALAAGSRPGIVTLRDGQKVEGEITEDGGVISVRSKQHIDVRVGRDQVAEIAYTEEPELEFNRRRNDLGSADVAGRIALARYCFDHGRADLAKGVLAEALNLDPNNDEASGLYQSARAQVDLARRREAREGQAVALMAAPPATRPAGGPGGAMRGGAATSKPDAPATRTARRAVLDADQINRVKQVEMRDADTAMTYRFDHDVERRYASAAGMTLPKFREMTPMDRFMQMRSGGAGNMMNDVRLLRDPLALAEYRRLQPRILTGCASAGCHGGDSTRLVFVTVGGAAGPSTPAEVEAALYTNFYLLATQRAPVILASGSRANYALINRVSPDQSLLLQFSLDPKLARFPHPPVPNFHPMFRSTTDAGFTAMLKWITDTLDPAVRPEDYGFAFGPPVDGGLEGGEIANPKGPTSAPTSRGATRPGRGRGAADGGAGGDPRPGPNTTRPTGPFRPGGGDGTQGNAPTNPPPGMPPANPPR